MKIELIKVPSDEDWMFCKKCTLNTVSKSASTLPTEEWKEKLIKSEHSPIRTLWFGIKMEIPYYVSTHFVRHKHGIEHFVSTQRTDRTGVDRDSLPQDTLVSHIMYVNAQELVNIAHMRLCNQADPSTRQIMREIVDLVVKACPYMKDVLVPKCVYRGGICDEFTPCGK